MMFFHHNLYDHNSPQCPSQKQLPSSTFNSLIPSLHHDDKPQLNPTPSPADSLLTPSSFCPKLNRFEGGFEEEIESLLFILVEAELEFV